MNSPLNVEEALQRLGNDWPAGDSLIDRVLRDLEGASVRPAAKTVRPPVLRRVLAVAASVAAVAALWSVFRSSESLYAQALEAVHQARTFQMVLTAPAEGDKPQQRLLTVSYERGVGFCEELPNEVAIGNSQGLWRYLKQEKLAIRSSGTGLTEMVNRVLENEVGLALKDAKYQRYVAGDQVVNGQPCQAFLMTRAEDRTIVLRDDRSRIVRIVTEGRSGERWVERLINDWKYDVPLEGTLFQASFPADVRVVDADAAFNLYVDLEKAVHREERKGLWYAIHRAERVENGGLFLVSSVRGTDATLKQYPLTQRRLQPGMIFVEGPATNYRGSQEYRVPGYTVELASVDHEGINLSWWVLLPLAGVGEAPFEVEPGKVKVPVGVSPTGGEYGKANFEDANGVLRHLTWDIELALPQPESLPSLEMIARQVYTDVASLEGTPFKFLNLGNRGMTVPYWSDLQKVTRAQFTEAVADDIRWWQAGCPVDDHRYQELRKTPARSR